MLINGHAWRDETACFKPLGFGKKCWGQLVLGRKDYARHTEMKREDRKLFDIEKYIALGTLIESQTSDKFFHL